MLSNITMLVLANMLALGLLVVFLAPSREQKMVRRRLEATKQRHVAGIVLEREFRRLIAARRFQKNFGPQKLLPNLAQLEHRLMRTGKNIPLNTYLAVNIGLILFWGIGFSMIGASLSIVLLASLGVGILLPHFVIGFMAKQRTQQFIARFPDAIELMVRGLRSSLPIGHSMDVVATDFSGPVGEEFQHISDRIKIGQSMDKALIAAGDRIGLPEFRFFCISLAIQRETGGNLSETLANLADVLRKRAQMKLKIKAMSSEAKASATIIGVLPFLVFGLILTISPDYMKPFFSDERLMMVGIGAIIWLGIGGFVMAKMSDFEV